MLIATHWNFNSSIVGRTWSAKLSIFCSDEMLLAFLVFRFNVTANSETSKRPSNAAQRFEQQAFTLHDIDRARSFEMSARMSNVAKVITEQNSRDSERVSEAITALTAAERSRPFTCRRRSGLKTPALITFAFIDPLLHDKCEPACASQVISHEQHFPHRDVNLNSNLRVCERDRRLVAHSRTGSAALQPDELVDEFAFHTHVLLH